MSTPHAPGRDSPTRWQALVFHLKTRVLHTLASPDPAALRVAILAVIRSTAATA